jgi:hypothetical protein
VPTPLVDAGHFFEAAQKGMPASIPFTGVRYGSRPLPLSPAQIIHPLAEADVNRLARDELRQARRRCMRHVDRNGEGPAFTAAIFPEPLDPA